MYDIVCVSSLPKDFNVIRNLSTIKPGTYLQDMRTSYRITFIHSIGEKNTSVEPSSSIEIKKSLEFSPKWK